LPALKNGVKKMAANASMPAIRLARQVKNPAQFEQDYSNTFQQGIFKRGFNGLAGWIFVWLTACRK
jgi:hypothetical protein